MAGLQEVVINLREGALVLIPRIPTIMPSVHVRMSHLKVGCSTSPMSLVSQPVSALKLPLFAKAEVLLVFLHGNSVPCQMPMFSLHFEGNRKDPWLLCRSCGALSTFTILHLLTFPQRLS